jgi:L-lactate dehydrogenase complex protein LldF
VEEAGLLPNASSLCGRCEAVCPMGIPLPKLLRHWRDREFAAEASPWMHRAAIRLWAFVALRPRLYRFIVKALAGILSEWAKPRGHFRWLPLAGAWLKHRDLPAPPGRTFHAMWKSELNRRHRNMGGMR